MIKIKNSKTLNHHIMESQKNMRWPFMLIFNVLNVKILTLEEEKIARRRWINHKIQVNLNLNNWYAPTVVRYLFKIAQNTAKTLFNSNVNFVVQQLNGSVGETHIFVSLATKDNVIKIMLANTQNRNYQYVQAQNYVRLEVTIMEMVNKRH